MDKLKKNYFINLGFGTIDADFWLGLDKIHELTKNKNQQLQIDLESYSGEQLSIKYNVFYIGDESNNYRLTIGEPDKQNLNYANSFTLHNGSYFVTKDKYDLYNCAKKFEAGWWFVSSPQCHHNVLLNGAYYSNSSKPLIKDGIQWATWKKEYLKAVQMKITDKKNY